MPMEIKICGLKRVEDALMVNEFENIKYVGFVFANTSRKITIEKALEIKKNLRPDIKTSKRLTNILLAALISL